MVDHHDAGAVEALGLVHKQVAAFVVHVVGNDKALWREEEWIKVNYCCGRHMLTKSLSYFVLWNIQSLPKLLEQ